MVRTRHCVFPLIGGILLSACSGGGTSGGGGTIVTPTPTAVNHAPMVAATIATQDAKQDTAFSFAIPAGTFTDSDGDALTLTATRTDGTALPGWLAFSAGTLSGTPDFADAGAVAIRIQAADGKGGTVTTDFNLQVAPAPAIPLSLNSYQNFKAVGVVPHAPPAGVETYDNARGWGDFTGHHRLDLFVAANAKTYPDRKPANYVFYERQKDGTLKPSAIRVTGADQACLVPRKAVIADFNGDGKPDAFVACHGLDQPPFPGEQSTVVLSQADGSYAIRKASADIGFFHGASSIDANGDGKPDIIASGFNDGNLGLLINQGDGSFVRDSSWKLSTFGVFTVEIADVNEDGKLDLLLGGHEWEAPARVFLGDGTANFPAIAPIVLPTVAGTQISLDFLLTGTGATRALWVFRVLGQGPDGGPNFYKGRAIQRIAWPSLTSTLPYQDAVVPQLPWLVPATVGGVQVVSSDYADMSTPLN